MPINQALEKKSLIYIFNMKEFFTYLKKLKITDYNNVGVWLIKDMLNYNGIIVDNYISNLYSQLLSVDDERLRLYECIFIHLANNNHYDDTMCYVTVDKGEVMLKFEYERTK